MGWIEATREREKVERRRNDSLGVSYLVIQRLTVGSRRVFLVISHSRRLGSVRLQQLVLLLSTTIASLSRLSSLVFPFLAFFFSSSSLLFIFIFSSLDVTDPPRLKSPKKVVFVV